MRHMHGVVEHNFSEFYLWDKVRSFPSSLLPFLLRPLRGRLFFFFPVEIGPLIQLKSLGVCCELLQRGPGPGLGWKSLYSTPKVP